MESTNLYDNGTPFDKKEIIDLNLKESIIAIKDKQPIVIIIDGGQSTGKTTLATLLADRFNHLCGKPPMDLTNKSIQYSQGGEQFIHRLPQASDQGYPIAIYDETGDYSRKSALSKFNKTMDRAMDIIRVYRTAIIIIVHNFAKQIPNEIIDKGIATMLIHCKKRKPGIGYVNAKTYDYQGMCWIKHYMKTEIVPENAYKKVYPNFQFRFKNLPPEREEALDRLSTKNKKDLWNNVDIKIQGLMDIKEIARNLNYSVATIRKKLLEHKIKESLISKKKKYYSQDTLQQLK